MNPEAVKAWIEGNGGARMPEFYYQCGAAMVAMEDYFSQHEDGLLSDERDDDQSGTAIWRVHRQSLCW
jgi:hypothetical protein